MTILRPFGYSSTRTLLQICCFWIWLALGLFLHFVKWRNTKVARAREADEEHETVVAVNKSIQWRSDTEESLPIDEESDAP